MHSNIYQITEKRVKEQDWMTEDGIREYEYDSYGIDYARQSDNERSEDLEYLRRVLPNEVFTLRGSVITIKNDGKAYCKKVNDEVAEWSKKLNSEDEREARSARYHIQCLNERRTMDSTLFHFDDYAGGVCYLDDLLDYASYNVGKKLYVGGILDYHF